MANRRSSRLIWSLLAILASLALGLAACGRGDDTSGTGGSAGSGASTGTGAEPSGSPAPRAETVEMVDFSFDSPTVTIQVGGKVIWKNQGQAPHTATADDGSFDSGTVQPGKLKSETFKQTGIFDYHCEIHPQMHGTIKVAAG